MPYYARRKRGPPRRRYSRAVGFRKQAPRLSSGKRRSLYRLSRSGYSSRGGAARAAPALALADRLVPYVIVPEDMPLPMEADGGVWEDVVAYGEPLLRNAAATAILKATLDDPVGVSQRVAAGAGFVRDQVADIPVAGRMLYEAPWKQVARVIYGTAKKFAETQYRGVSGYMNRRRGAVRRKGEF